MAMINEMALMCDKLGLDVWEVINAAASSPSASCPSTRAPAWQPPSRWTRITWAEDEDAQFRAAS